MRTRGAPFLIAVLAAGLVGAPAAAKTCKARITAIGLSTGKADVKVRETRARRSALSAWRTKAQKMNGFAYRFWSRAEDRQATCQSSKGHSRCLVSARPCRLI